jgi:hypothetical protein
VNGATLWERKFAGMANLVNVGEPTQRATRRCE